MKSSIVILYKGIMHAVAGVPEIRVTLLFKYFANRFNLQDHNPTNFLGAFGDRRLLPFFYTDVIPSSLSFLVEDALMPYMKDQGSVYRKFKRKLSARACMQEFDLENK